MGLKKIFIILALTACLAVLLYFLSRGELSPTIKLELNQEYLSPDEETIADEMVEFFQEFYAREYPSGKRPVLRALHAKSNGCVKGEFLVESDLPKEVRYGLFKEPRAYPAIIRFSNADEKAEPDNTTDGRGMAVKVLGIDHKIQDFLAINQPVFLTGNPKDLLEFMKASLVHGGFFKFFFPSFNPFKWRLHNLWILAQLKWQKIAGPLQMNYWSTTPYRLGPRAVKFMIKSRNVYTTKVAKTDPNWMAEDLAAYLKNEDAHFDFLIQFQTDPYKMPIEDSSVEWDAELSPFYKVATLTIPKRQAALSSAEIDCEPISFNSWHTLPEFQPLGGLNRVRKMVYPRMVMMRNKMNQNKELTLRTEGGISAEPKPKYRSLCVR